jgi:hypothetical protein
MQDAQATEFLMLDDDISVDLETISRMQSLKLPFVGVLGGTKWPPYTISIKPVANAKPVDGLLEVRAASIQCALIQRKYIERAWKAYEQARCTLIGKPALAIFSSLIVNGELYGEDTSFCLRLRYIGCNMKIMMDANVQHGPILSNMAKQAVNRVY